MEILLQLCRENKSYRAILHSRCSSCRWDEINYQHWLLCHWVRRLRSSKLPSDCPHFHPQESPESFPSTESSALTRATFSPQERDTRLCFPYMLYFNFCVAWVNIIISTKYSEKKTKTKTQPCLATSSKTSRMHLTKNLCSVMKFLWRHSVLKKLGQMML